MLQLSEVLSMFWMVLSVESPDGDVLFKDQFTHFLYLLQSAFLGPQNVSEAEILKDGEQEFIQNVGYYGEFCQFAFNDVMAECVGKTVLCFYYTVITIVTSFEITYIVLTCGVLWTYRMLVRD